MRFGYHFVHVVPDADAWVARCAECDYCGEPTTWDSAERDAAQHEEQNTRTRLVAINDCNCPEVGGPTRDTHAWGKGCVTR